MTSFAMEDVRPNEVSESLLPGILKIPGEPAVLINGVPDIPSCQGNPVSSNNAPDPEQPRCTGFGEWMEGREVKKMFGDEYYPGTVTEYDKETGWYRVVYEDGDFEDLEWHELRDLLEPLDISIPLKSVALKIIKKSENQKFPTSIKTDVSLSARPSASNTKSGKPRGRPRKV